jgi:membrane-associated phospholipid phosphatase
MHARPLQAALLLACLLFTGKAGAQDEHRLSWHSDWRRVGGIEYAVTTGMFATFVGVWFLPPAAEPIWTEPVLFDTATRDALRLHTRHGRNIAGSVSDGVALVSYLPPLIIDPLIVAGFGDRNPDVAWQLFIISMQSYSITFVLNAVSKRVLARERPYARPCLKDPEYSSSCKHQDRFRSFYSGHAAITATSAGLICAQHTHVPLYGPPEQPDGSGGEIDRGVCIAAIAGMLTTGTLRIVADKHWASDVIVGTFLGLSVGYLLPTLVYFKSFESKPDAADSRIAITGQPLPLMSYAGTF